MPEIAEALGGVGSRGLAVSPPAPALWRDYVTLTKPRIMSLLVLTSVCAMVAAAGGSPEPLALAGLVTGGILACAGASSFNHVLDRDIDCLMGPRTASRPVAAGRIPASRAALFGLTLSALSFVDLAVLDNMLAAALALLGGAYYVVVYTLWLKRTTSQNIVIGGAAGAIPPLTGWAAAHGHLGLGALLLFAIVFLWTPPHFWALAMLLKPGYKAAQIPMLPVIRGERVTANRVLIYTVVLVAASLVPALVGVFGTVYLAAAVVLGAGFAGLAWRLWRQTTPGNAALTFHFSLLYLALLFAAVAVDAAA